MYAPACLICAVLTGMAVILLLQTAESFSGISGIVRMGIYVVSALCFLGGILYIAQGFLDTVNRIRILWNLRFQTELEQFSVNGGAAPGALLFWSLLSVPLAFFILMLVKRRSTGMIFVLVICALFEGFVLGRSQIWLAVLCLLAGIFGTLVFTAAPKRRNGIRGMTCMLLAAVLFLVLFYITGGYKGLNQIARWRADTVAWFERFRYGEDTLPKGDLTKARLLLDGEEETLELNMDKPQEWYLRGFVGGTYEGNMWRSLSMEAYQGEYEGLLKWLETKDFLAVTQFADYNGLTEATERSDAGSVGVRVNNVGAYRKFIYLPASVEEWTAGRSEVKKDWQVRSKGLFGTGEYEFQAVEDAPTADGVVAASWLTNPSGHEEEEYLDAESVYHSFAEDCYTEVDDELKAFLEEKFFPEEEAMDFNDVTAQIRRVLRQETRYVEEPQAAPSEEDFIRWFLEDSRKGNAVHFASAAVMAYRTAGYAARYVEGYHYPARAGQLQEETTVTLTNKNAHAWAEVYVAGVGWMPVEVVPGMYTEMYTNQIVEGEPTFQVDSNPGEEGLEVEGGSADAAEPEETPAKTTPSLRKVLSVVLFCLYLCLAIYLLLEMQRAIRLMLRKMCGRQEEGRDYTDGYAEKMRRLLVIGKVKGDYDHPMELSGQIEEKIAGISREEYERAVKLIQKVRFGGKELRPYEMHTLECFAERLSEALYVQGGIWRRMKMRYWCMAGK